MANYNDEEENEIPQKPKKVYIIIDGKKHYIDPEIVKKYNLETQKNSFFSGNKLYFEKG